MISISYGDIAVGAKEQSTATMQNIENFVDLTELKRTPNLKNYASIGELNNTILDGRSLMFPTNPQSVDTGVWSNVLSDSSGAIDVDATLLLSVNFEERITTTGITLTFDTFTGCYSNDLTLEWYNGNSLVASERFYPNSINYSCEKLVENFDRLDFYFHKLNMPYSRLRISSLDFGVGRVFTGEDIYNAKIIEEVNLASDGVAINTFDFSIISGEGASLIFQRKQPLEVRLNNDLLGLFFVESSSRQQVSGHYNVKAEDYIGLLDGYDYHGGVYSQRLGSEIIAEICGLVGIPFEIDEGLKDRLVTGYLPYLSAREALAQVCLAMLAVVDTSRSDKLRIRSAVNLEKSHDFTLDDVLDFQELQEDSKITAIDFELAIPSGAESEKTVLFEMGREVNEMDENEQVLVVFDKPAENLSIVNGEIVSSSVNSAVIIPQDFCKLTGNLLTFEVFNQRFENEKTIMSDPQNEIKVGRLGLFTYIWFLNEHIPIPPYGLILSRYFRNKKLKQKLAISNQRVGDVVSIPTQYSGTQICQIESLRYTLTGGAIVAEAEGVVLDDNG